MKKWRILGWVLGLAVVLTLVIFHLPVERSVSMPVCNGSDEPKQLDMDLKFYRHLIGGTTVKGTLVFDGEKYMDQLSINKTVFRGSNSRGLNSWWKADGLWNTSFRLVPSEDTLDVMDKWDESYSQQVYFLEIGPGVDIEQVIFFYTDLHKKNEVGAVAGVPYIGPAETLEEAQNVAEKMGYTFLDGKVGLKSETFQ